LVPLNRLASAVRTIDVRSLERRLPVRGAGDELDEVADAFNATLARLEAAVGDMRQFGAAMAHELRTPLAALRGEIDLAWRSPAAGEAERDRFASQLEDIDRLTRLIDHILALARAESGEIPLARAPVDLARLTRDLVDQLEPLAAARSIALRGDAPGAVVVQGDAGWLQRLVINLVDNAVKFTGREGHVVVRVVREGDTARLDVADTGVGLSPEDAGRVFDRFFRADLARSSSTEGAGLGLSLVRWIAAQHEGTVSVRSAPGAGSTFTVRLPVAAPA
jgi:heavy metal sensor kinase